MRRRQTSAKDFRRSGLPSSSTNDKNVQKLRQVLLEHRSDAINNVGNTVGLAYGTHKNHTLKQEAGCCKILVPVMNDEQKYKDQQLPDKTGTNSLSISQQVMKFGSVVSIHKR
jgi:hypothetical protein